MKKLYILLLTGILCCSVFNSHAESSSGFYAGLRNTRYIYGGYRFSDNFKVELNHSLFSEKIGYQAVGAKFGYARSIAKFDLGASVSGSTAWNGSYGIVSGAIDVRYNPLNVLSFEGTLSPLYDSGYGYNTCFSVGAAVNITRQINIMARYTTIPDYRKSEKRIRGGFGFKVKNLYVEPNVSVPVSGSEKFKNLRVLVNFNYCFIK